jgi:hypothetical protein
MRQPPAWLVQFWRIRAALKKRRALAPEDADDLLRAMDSAADARDGAAQRSIEQGLAWPSDWRSAKRQFERDEALIIAARRGYRGRDGARRLHKLAQHYAATAFERDRRLGHIPAGDLGIAHRLLSANSGKLPSESYLAKLLTA